MLLLILVDDATVTLSAGNTGSGEKIDYASLGWTTLGTFAASACANTLNQIYEVKSDGQMIRTRMRPLPLGKVSRGQALAFAGIMGAGGIAILLEKVLWL